MHEPSNILFGHLEQYPVSALKVPWSCCILPNRIKFLLRAIDQLKGIISNMHGQKLVVTERSAPFINTGSSGIAESKVLCNSDEVVTGGGFVVNRQGHDFETLSSSASGNGWSVILADGSAEGEDSLLFKAVAECAKLS